MDTHIIVEAPFVYYTVYLFSFAGLSIREKYAAVFELLPSSHWAKWGVVKWSVKELMKTQKETLITESQMIFKSCTICKHLKKEIIQS